VANLFSLPRYIPDQTSSEFVAGYEVQSCTDTAGLPIFTGVWNDIPNSPFASNNNIVDTTAGANWAGTQYRARPVRQVMVGGSPVTLDTPFSPPFLAGDAVYDSVFTRLLLPTLRFTYMGDNGVRQSAGTVAGENTGAGLGLWAPDGAKTRFAIQWVSDDDPVRVIDNTFQMVHRNSSGYEVSSVPDQDYMVDLKGGWVEFQYPPTVGSYLRFDFARGDFINMELLQGLKSAINTLSQFGINGYEAHTENNLKYIKAPLNNDLIEIICKLAIWLMRQGATESALRSTMTWRDSGVQEDPYPSRALQFLVQDLQVTEKSMQTRANAYIRNHTSALTRGETDIFFDGTQGTPFNPSIFAQFTNTFGGLGGTGSIGPSLYGNFNSWWL
jgi:hypothetical protein